MVVLNGVLSILGAILKGVQLLVSGLARLPFQIRFIVFWIFGVLFLLFNSSIYGDKASFYQTFLLVYTAALALSFAHARAQNPFLTLTMAEFVVVFALTAAGAAFVFKALAPFNPEHAVLNTQSIAIALTHVTVVAVGEELIFRVLLPGLLSPPLHPMAAQVLSGLGFGLAHMTAYGGNWHTMAFAAILGIVFGAIVYLFPRYGIVITIAAHAMWNLNVLGFV